MFVQHQLEQNNLRISTTAYLQLNKNHICIFFISMFIYLAKKVLLKLNMFYYSKLTTQFYEVFESLLYKSCCY